MKKSAIIKEPPVRFVKRDSIKGGKAALFYILAILIALALGCVLLAVMGADPFEFFINALTIGMFDSINPMKSVEGFINIFVPLLITSLGLSLAFKMKFWNIGGEGQFLIGTVCASAMAFLLGSGTPSVIVLILIWASGAIGAGLYGLISAFFKVKLGTNETLLTLMFNYIALYLVTFFKSEHIDFFRDTTVSRLTFKVFSANAWMPVIKLGSFNLNVGLLIALAVSVVIYIYMAKTKHGYEINVVGDSPNTAKYAGMNVKKIILRTVFLSAALVGLAGAIEVSSAHVMSESITNGVGWTGIIVAWLSKFNPFAILATTGLLSILEYGSKVAIVGTSIDSSIADLLQGLILFVILASDFFIRYKIVIRKKGSKPDGTVTEKETKADSSAETATEGGLGNE